MNEIKNLSHTIVYEADFFMKKRWLYIGISQLFASFVLLCLLQAVYLTRASEVWLGKSFYFLVSQNEHIEVSTHETRLNGGAGYLLDYEGKEYVVLAVYLNETDGQTVQASLVDKTELLQINVDRLYFKGKEKKKKRTVYEGALNSLYGCLEVLSQGISRLDRGMTQEACRRILSTLSKQFSYMASAYKESYPHFSNVCAVIQAKLEELMGETVYGKDLRYLLCDACTAYIRLTMQFAL